MIGAKTNNLREVDTSSKPRRRFSIARLFCFLKLNKSLSRMKNEEE